MVPVLPFSLKERIGVPQDEVQSYVSYSLTVFAAALLVSSPIWGYVADHTQNRRTPMLVGLAILLAASVFLCFSVTIGMMMVGRIAQGLSGALIWSVGLAMIIDSVDRDKIGEAMG
ncbi:hypothetical protein K4F52_002904 [Lecanicillium sp. MT-2017a]|nr:hypothetical protein K4F52_002904 [Lecanicillium sp. MT-2017a]